jgi:hypothetical protein
MYNQYAEYLNIFWEKIGFNHHFASGGLEELKRSWA